MAEISTLIADALAFVLRRWAGRLLPRRPAFFYALARASPNPITVVSTHDAARVSSRSTVGDQRSDSLRCWLAIGQLFVAVGGRTTDGGSWGSCNLSGPPCGFVPDSKANPQVLSVDVTDARKCHQTLHRPAPRKTVHFRECRQTHDLMTQPRGRMLLRKEKAPPDQEAGRGLWDLRVKWPKRFRPSGISSAG